jgi:hypothetical protein
MSRTLRRHWRLVVVLALAAFAFGRSVQFGYSLLDDRTFVRNNPLIAAPLGQGLVALLTTPSMGYPHTVTVLSFALDRRLLGPDPAGHHAVNVGVHLGVVTLAYLLLLRLGVRRTLAGTAVALLALHPLVTEPVCWVIGRKDLLAAALLLGAFLVAAGGARPARPSLGRLAAVVGVTVLAMLAKPSTILAPLMLWPFVRTVRPDWRWTDALAVVVPSALAAAMIGSVGLGGLAQQDVFVQRTRAELFLNPIRATTLQVQHLFWPRDLLADYYPIPGDPTAWAMLLTLAGGIAAVAYAARRTAPRSVERLAVVLLTLSFLPAAGILQTSHWSADSYFYLPLVWVTLALATIIPRYWPGLVGFPLIAAGLALLSIVQTRTWASPVATFAPVVARYPDEPRALNRLAFAFADEQNSLMSSRTFVEIEERFPDFPFNRGQRATSFMNLGDRRRADAIFARCVALNDADCSFRFWMDVLNGRRRTRDASAALVGGTYERAAALLARASSPDRLRTIAGWLREHGLEALARRAEADAAAKDAATSHGAGA